MADRDGSPERRDPVEPDGNRSDGSRFVRWGGLLGIGWRRIHHRLGRGGSRQTVVCVLGIALPVALLLLVASVSLGLATDPAGGADADYWVVPEGAESAVTDVGGAQLGDVHATAAAVAERNDVAHASPMLVDVVVAEADDGGRVHLLAVGVVPSERHDRIAPLPTDGFIPGDPYFADGTYDGEWTGEAVVTEAGANELGLDSGESFAVEGVDEPFTVAAVHTPATAGIAQLPVVVVHLSELQVATGKHDGDRADQLVVVAPDGTPATERALANLYPRTTVETRGGLLVERAVDSRLPAAVSLAALLIALVTGTLLVSTAFGFELAAESRHRRMLSALGVGGRSRAGLVGTELGVVSLYGGALGVAMWAVGTLLVNRLAVDRYGAPIAALDPRFALYGIAVALFIGLLSLPYLLVVGRRTGGAVSLR